jgi:hypothetical protein
VDDELKVLLALLLIAFIAAVIIAFVKVTNPAWMQLGKFPSEKDAIEWIEAHAPLTEPVTIEEPGAGDQA